jgi:hypothetical protein
METPWQVTKNPCMKQMMVSFEIWGKMTEVQKGKRELDRRYAMQVAMFTCNIMKMNEND